MIVEIKEIFFRQKRKQNLIKLVDSNIIDLEKDILFFLKMSFPNNRDPDIKKLKKDAYTISKELNLIKQEIIVYVTDKEN